MAAPETWPSRPIAEELRTSSSLGNCYRRTAGGGSFTPVTAVTDKSNSSTRVAVVEPWLPRPTSEKSWPQVTACGALVGDPEGTFTLGTSAADEREVERT
jgi:hypothetical protein